MNKSKLKFKDIAEYYSSFPADIQKTLQQFRHATVEQAATVSKKFLREILHYFLVQFIEHMCVLVPASVKESASCHQKSAPKNLKPILC